MAETPSQQPGQPVPEIDTPQYWCYHCDKRVSVATLANLPDITCRECNNGFIESILLPSRPPSAPPSGSSDQVNDIYFGSQFMQVLRLIAQTAHDDDVSPPPPPDRSSDDDFLRIEIGGWDNDEEHNEDDRVEFQDDGEEHEASEVRADRPAHDNPHGDDEDLQRRRRDVLRLRIRELATRTRSMRSRILDWAEVLMGLEDNSIEFQVHVPESDWLIGSPEDYADAAEYEALLQTLAEGDGGGRRGAPPAAKSSIEALPTVEIVSENEALVCAICKDLVGVGDMAKTMPCGHHYHGDCIITWLGSRNSCPVCRFELTTDDQEYEAERKKRATASASGASGSG